MNTTAHLRKLGSALCLIAGLAAFGSGFAQDGDPIRITNAAFQEVEVKAPDGQISKKLVPADKVMPGEEVIYKIEVANAGKDAATDIVVENPIPEGLLLTDDSRSPPTAVSVDGGKTYGDLASLTVPVQGGQPRPAQLSDVTHLRWVLARLAPGSDGEIVFRARVK